MVAGRVETRSPGASIGEAADDAADEAADEAACVEVSASRGAKSDAVVAEAAYAAVFNVLVLLDNDTGGPPLRPDSSDYAVYVHRYLTEADFAHNNPASSMRINDPQAGNPLHEILQELLPSDVDKPISLE